jgi:hypothetical protein
MGTDLTQPSFYSLHFFASWHSPKPVENYLTPNWADELVLLIDFQSLFFAIKRAMTEKK